MPEEQGKPERLRHLVVEGGAEAEAYAPRGRGPRLRIPQRQRQAHARHLLQQFRGLRTDIQALQQEREQFNFDPRAGLQLLFESSPDFDLKFDSLDVKREGIQLLSVQQRDGKTIAVCHVPDGKLDYFVQKIEAYRNEDTVRGKPKNRSLVESIEVVQLAAITALWTDPPERLPAESVVTWWEIWLRVTDDASLLNLRRAAEIAGFSVSDERIVFPERVVVTARCSAHQLSRSMRLVNSIAELREGKVTAAHFVELPPSEQHQLTADLLNRVVIGGVACAACLLDTGVTQAHPLLAPALQTDDCHTCKEPWGSADSHGHGTEMAGLALYGNLVDVMTSGGPIELEHCLESVKVIEAGDPNPPHLYGAITIQAVNLAEAAAPDRVRAIGLAITAESLEQGEPSTWSAAVDALTSGYTDDHRRLLLVSAGNSDSGNWVDHPAGVQNTPVQDPGQSWNALTVGACTDLVDLPGKQYPDWKVVAERGDVSPFSSTSSSWSRPWPLKPEIVLEGGNCAIDPGFGQAFEVDPLALLTTYWRPQDRPFSLLGQTSAATALGARDAAILQARYPRLWPETIRGLMVHSARWTDAMRQYFLPLQTREQKERLLRYCGYGVPDFDKACWSARNELTLIAQDSLQPYCKDEESKRYKTKEINFHALPWPQEVLRGMGEVEVELRVTLSYFVEPNPARRGWKGRYRYASHALRFEVKTATESEEDFGKRVNLAARAEDDDQQYQGDAANWTLGPQLRHLGSIHSDWWTGTARDLADRGLLAVFPVVGWWRERPHLGRFDRRARYSLIVSIRTPVEEIDIYTPVEVAIEAAAMIDVQTDGEV